MAADAPVALYNHVDRVFPDLRPLSESAVAVQRLEADPGYQAVVKVLREEVDRIDRQLDSAPLREAEEYAFAHGRRGAILSFEGAVQAIIEKAAKREQAAEREAAGESAAER